jgi:hypothetical protein
MILHINMQMTYKLWKFYLHVSIYYVYRNILTKKKL